MPKKGRRKPTDPDYKPGGVTGKGFKPGQSGNPSGRPKYKLLSEAYRAKLAEELPDGRTIAEAIVDAMTKLAMKGKYMHASEIADRVEGKPRQAYDVELSVNDELAEIVEKARKRAAK